MLIRTESTLQITANQPSNYSLKISIEADTNEGTLEELAQQTKNAIKAFHDTFAFSRAIADIAPAHETPVKQLPASQVQPAPANEQQSSTPKPSLAQQSPQAKSDSKSKGTDRPASKRQQSMVYAIQQKLNISDQELCQKYQINDKNEMTMQQVRDFKDTYDPDKTEK